MSPFLHGSNSPPDSWITGYKKLLLTRENSQLRDLFSLRIWTFWQVFEIMNIQAKAMGANKKLADQICESVDYNQRVLLAKMPINVV